MALTTLAAVKGYLGTEEGDTSDDVLLTRHVDAASSWIESATGRTFAQTTYTAEIQNGPPYGGKYRASIIPKHFPVMSVTAVSVDGVTVPALANGSGWALVDDVIHLVGYYISPGIANVSITYVAGYQTTPPDVENAAVELVAWWYRGKEHVGALAVTSAGATTQYLREGYPPSLDAVIGSYRVPSAR